MAKKSQLAREKRRTALSDKYKDLRAQLRARSKDMNVSLEERMEARAQLSLLPRNSSPTRMHFRCAITGRSHGNLRRFGICRHQLRLLAHAAQLPGVTKSSW
jgi:small subunit ribosomal protein S14